MEEIKQTFLPEQFKIINEIIYYRLENGRVAVEMPTEVTIESSKEDVVELITLEKDSKKVRLWKINGKLYALASSSCVIVPEDITFVDCYFSANYPQGQYVKYMSSIGCGIIYVSETKVSNVISYEKGYVEICFENNLFYADSKEGDKYYVIGESGKLLGTFPSKCRKLDGYMLFYDDSSIFIDSFKFDIPGGVSSVEVIKRDMITFVKVVNSNGIYYYTKEIEYLFGPIQKDRIDVIDSESCFVYEIVNEKIVQVFYIKITKDASVCKNLSSQKEIECYQFGSESNDNFFVVDKVLYVLKDNDFIALNNGIDVDKYVITTQKLSRRWKYTILGYKKNIPVYLAYYESSYKKVYDEGTLEQIANGYKTRDGKFSHIYRKSNFKGNYIVVIDPDGNIVLSDSGENCYQTEYHNKHIYVIEKEKDKNKIALYDIDGKELYFTL